MRRGGIYGREGWYLKDGVLTPIPEFHQAGGHDQESHGGDGDSGEDDETPKRGVFDPALKPKLKPLSELERKRREKIQKGVESDRKVLEDALKAGAPAKDIMRLVEEGKIKRTVWEDWIDNKF